MKKLMKGNKKWYLVPVLLLLLLLLFGFLLGSLKSIEVITQNNDGRSGADNHSGWGSSSGIFDGVFDFIEDVGIMLTIVPDSDYGYGEDCILETEFAFGDCCDRCDPIAEDCNMMCTPAMMLMVMDDFLPDVPPDDVEINCYNDCMADTGCEFPYTREDIDTMCSTICIDLEFSCFDTEMECTDACTNFYLTEAIDETPDIALICDFEYDMAIIDCRHESVNESFTWDGTPVTDLNGFFQTGYPIFYDNSKSSCEGWFRTGTWIDTPDKVGCIDFGFFAEFGCGMESILSAQNVCETIGATWVCEEGDISCNI